MPGFPPLAADEREQLLTYLAQQRYLLRLTGFGLTDDQARATPSASALSVGGVIKHVAHTERHWIDIVVHRQKPFAVDVEGYAKGFQLLPGESLRDVLDFYDDVARETDAVIRGLSLDAPVPVPRDVPWFPDDVDAWTVRWVVLHLIEETARHAGHADIVRESVDGATWFPLMAAAENQPATPWVQPWRPTSAVSAEPPAPE